MEFGELASNYKSEIEADAANVEAYVGLAESQIMFTFGYIPKTGYLPIAINAYKKTNQLDSINSDVRKLVAL